MKIKSNGSITPNPFSIQQYNNNVDIKCFEIPRFYYGNTDSETDISELYDTNPVDLSTCNVIMRVTNPDDMIMQGNELYISTKTGEDEFDDDDDIVVVNWVITDNISQFAGKRTYQLEFYHEDKLVFRTQVMNFIVKESLDTEKNIIEKEPNLIKDFQDELTEIMGSAKDYSEYIDNTIEAEMQNKINYYHKYTSSYLTTSKNETTIPININAYSQTTILFVFVNGIMKKEGIDYTIDGNNVVFNNGFSVVGTEIYFVCLKSITTDIKDYDLFKGEKGADGKDGLGVPSGGTTGQVLAKKSDTDNDTEWTDLIEYVKFHSIVKASACHIVEFKNGKKMFIDTGLLSEWEDIKDAIDSLNITKFDYGIVTHCHCDHIGNLQNMFTTYDLSECTIYTQGEPDFTNYGDKFMDGEETVYNDMMSIFSSNNCTPIVPTNDSYITIDEDTKLHFMNTDINFYADYYNAKAEGYDKTNNNLWSLVTEIIHKNNVILTTGDIESIVEEKITPYVHKCNIMTAPHHMVNISAYKGFYDITNPEICVAQFSSNEIYFNDICSGYKYLHDSNTFIVNRTYNNSNSLLYTFISNGYTIENNIVGSKYTEIEKPQLYRNVRDLINYNNKLETEITLEEIIDNMVNGSILKTSTHPNYPTQFTQFYNDLSVIFPLLNTRWWNIQINKGFNSEYCEIIVSDENLTFKAIRSAKSVSWKISGHGVIGSNILTGGRMNGNSQLISTLKKLPVGHYISAYLDDVGSVLVTDGAYNISIDVYYNENYENVNASIHGVLRGGTNTNAKAVVSGYINTSQSQQWWKAL